MKRECQIITNSVRHPSVPISSKYGLLLGEMEANRPCGPNSRSLVKFIKNWMLPFKIFYKVNLADSRNLKRS